MSFSVKITTGTSWLDLLCPHFCMGCGRLGRILCDCCKNYINISTLEKDVKYEEAVKMWGERCGGAFVGFYECGFREGLMDELVKTYKYKSVRAIGQVLVELLDEVLPEIEVVAVPLPTIRRHVRERGLDHTLVIAKRLAKRRGWRCERLLRRMNDAVQVGVSAKKRKLQAEKAYRCDRVLDGGKVYLLLDDVWTTGSSMLAASEVLIKAGATKIAGAVLVMSK